MVPFKSHCYFFKIYLAADTAKSKPEADLLDLISRNRDIVITLEIPPFPLMSSNVI